jgi:hypothetical protein
MVTAGVAADAQQSTAGNTSSLTSNLGIDVFMQFAPADRFQPSVDALVSGEGMQRETMGPFASFHHNVATDLCRGPPGVMIALIR